MNCFFWGRERRSSNRFSLLSPIHLMADSGQILIGFTQNIGSHGLRAEFPKSIETGAFVTFRFSHEKASVEGDGRVVWSGPARG